MLMRILILVWLLVAGVSCGASQPTLNPSAVKENPSTVKETVISLQKIDCQSCGMRSAMVLDDIDGVESAKFDRKTAEVRIRYDATLTSPESLAAVVRDRVGYEASVGAGKGAYTPNVEFPPELDMVIVSASGEDVDIEQKRVAGKVTVFDFYAEWCGPCKDVDREMLAILRDNDDVALRKLNAEDWDSPIAKRYLAKIPSLPYVIVYSKKGERVAAISGLKLEELRRAIDTARLP